MSCARPDNLVKEVRSGERRRERDFLALVLVFFSPKTIIRYSGTSLISVLTGEK